MPKKCRKISSHSQSQVTAFVKKSSKSYLPQEQVHHLPPWYLKVLPGEPSSFPRFHPQSTLQNKCESKIHSPSFTNKHKDPQEYQLSQYYQHKAFLFSQNPHQISLLQAKKKEETQISQSKSNPKSYNSALVYKIGYKWKFLIMN